MSTVKLKGYRRGDSCFGIRNHVVVMSTVSWCLFGTAISRWLATPRIVTVFNLTMAALLVLSVIPMVV